MSDMDQATLTSSSSQLETVQPFTIEESPGLEVGIESPKMMDSSTLMCTSIDKSPAISGALKYSKPNWLKHNVNSFSKQMSHNNDATVSSDSSDASIGGDSSDASDIDEDDFATNQSAKSTASEQLSTSGTSANTSNTGSTSGKTNTNDNKATDDETDLEDEETPNASESVDSVENSESDPHGSSTDAGATGVQSSESDRGLEGEQTGSAFANLRDSAEAISEPTDKSGAPQGSVRGNAKNELANLIEKAILDFCSSRTVETMRRMFGGVTNDNESLQRDGGRHDDKSANTPHPVTGELVKEGVIIGAIDIFAPRMQREYILPIRDSLISAFLKDPGVFRAICYRTRCQVEVTRRLLNRKLCISGRWHKYMIIRILGPTYKSIYNCDVLLQKAVPEYKARKEYPVQSICRVFLREDVPDNAELYYSYQRTGGTSQRFGALKLESPYRSTLSRNVSSCPWKFGLFKPGKLAFSCPNVRMCMKHVYPSFGYQTTSNLEPKYQGVNATERIHTLHEKFHLRRQAALTLKRNLTIPVCR